MPPEGGGPGWKRLWRYGPALVAPVVIWGLLVAALVQPVRGWIQGEQRYDQAAVQEWLEEARNADVTLADLVNGYVDRGRKLLELGRLQREKGAEAEDGNLLTRFLEAREPVAVKREEIHQHLRSLGEPPKMYPGQLPLFPMIYRLEVHFKGEALVGGEEVTLEGGPALTDPVVWDSGQEPSAGQDRTSEVELGAGWVKVRYQLRAWKKGQRDEQERAVRVRQLGLLALGGSVLGVGWLMLVQAGEREHHRQRRLARERLVRAERERIEEERRRVETERQLLEQRLATQAAERQALELKSHLYASIGIMAGSYAHNIKNLLVRPNDLLRRCLERELPAESERMLKEVQQTLGTVTERLQQILQTVRRDPSRSELRVLDLNAGLREMGRTWGDLAQERWQLDLVLELAGEPLWVSGDSSHLQQAVENLLFNARDATFEMRNHHREAARRGQGMDAQARRQALIQAAAWRGKVVIRSRREEGGRVVLEVSDNGAGMTEEVLRRCTETHFSTKRDNALYEGHSTGMGLGLSFVVAILENHKAKLEIESRPLAGTTFRVIFPAAEEAGEKARKD